MRATTADDDQWSDDDLSAECVRVTVFLPTETADHLNESEPQTIHICHKNSDDDSMKPRRNAALQLLKLRLGI